MPKAPAEIAAQIAKNPENFTAFRNSIKEKFFGRWKYRLMFIAYAVMVAATIYASLVLCRDYGYRLSAGLLLGCAWAWTGWLQHYSGHVGFWGYRPADFACHLIFENLWKGGSGAWWRSRHNKHHAMPNMIGVDGDLATTPLLAWDPILAKKCPSWALKIQDAFFLIWLFLYVPVLGISARMFAYKKRLWPELAMMGVHYYLLWQFFKGTDSQGFYDMGVMFMLAYGVQGVYLGFFFGLNHFAEDRITDKNL